jgi:short-subunit dehydrogenase
VHQRAVVQKTVLITGCSSGIGYDTAHYLHNNGYRVFATARNMDDVNRLKNEGLDAYVLDVTKTETIDAALDAILIQTEGTLYALFNNAGYGQPGAVEDIRTEVLKEQFSTNVFGLHEMTRRIIPIMRKQGYGRIIEHSSVLGIISLRFRGAYNASKYAVEGLCDTLRQELDGSNIHVITLNTGPVTSDFRKNAIAKFVKNVDAKESVFKQEYEEQLLNSNEEKEDDFFTCKSDAVIDKVVLALEKKQPKPRYYITFATHLLGTLKRLLPTSVLDKILAKI